MIQLPKDFKELLGLLNSKRIEYLVIGGYAVALDGYPRATGNPPLRIKIITSIDGVEFSECYKNKKVATIDDIEINFISLEDLKKKRESGRHKDLDDLEHLE